ncbi:MAG: TraM recognition domain-containing protein [Rhodospirillales bacterium]|nr:TraM recognition domain-containing protein [Rhodospirillales bacterium]MCB9965748.1 TraM recognition domain-containing protein [Rhodospirillales bacterium]
MAIDSRKYEYKYSNILRDTRPVYVRIGATLKNRDNSFVFLLIPAIVLALSEVQSLPFQPLFYWADIMLFTGLIYFWWLSTRNKQLPFKFPLGANLPDKNNGRGGKPGKSEGILYLGNLKNTNEEVWFTNSDARTHILYLGTTGAGKTEGLKAMVTNALTWGSGFVYVDGKADTDLWSSLSALCRRFGRDDDLLVLNYMTGNAEGGAPSNTMNPFSSGSSSYLVNMLTNLMPEAEGDNVMWKERAVSLVSAIMPALVWKRDHLDIPLFVTSIRDSLNLNKIIALSREEVLPREVRSGVKGYLDTLPGYNDLAFDDNGQMKPPGPDVPPVDMNTMSNQHGFLTMQLTRSLQSLGEDYGYIFNTPAADVDMVDVVLNRRILVVLIPALEKSGDEIANLGKIIAANMKGMMGSALGATVEGSSETVIDNKPTNSATPFMTVFDEVGYYTAQGMAVMAAQARSLGFCLVFSGQDLPAMKKRVREEANSITANCNIKIFGKLEDPTETKDFFEKTVGTGFFTEVTGFSVEGGGKSYFDSKQASIQLRPRASYDGLREFKEGEAVTCFAGVLYDTKIFYPNPGHAKAMRVTRFLGLQPPDDSTMKYAKQIRDLRDRLVHKSWTAKKSKGKSNAPRALLNVLSGLQLAEQAQQTGAIKGVLALANIYAAEYPQAVRNMIHPDLLDKPAGSSSAEDSKATPVAAALPASPQKIAATPSRPAEDGTPAKPSVFGGQVPQKVAAATAEDAAPTSKPSIFGGAPAKAPVIPAAPQQPMRQIPQPVTLPSNADDKNVVPLRRADVPRSADDILRDAALKARKAITSHDDDLAGGAAE